MIIASIIVPAYNAAAHVGRAIASACAQTERRIEIIVIDDCSTDATADAVRQLALGDDRIRLLRTPTNAGPSAARNIGLKAAQGQWIALLDADDHYRPQRIERMVAFGEQLGADIVADNLLLHHQNCGGSDAPMISAAELPDPRELSLTEFVESSLSMGGRKGFGFLKPIFRRDFLNTYGLSYDENDRYAEDFMFYVRCLLSGAKCWIMPEALYQYTVRKGSLVDNPTPRDLMRIRQMDERLLSDPRVTGDRRLQGAIMQHKVAADRGYYFLLFILEVRARAFIPAIRVLLQDATSFRHIAYAAAGRVPAALRRRLSASIP
jgi:glycosyltransferase involved in cell wall biosynthesis